MDRKKKALKKSLSDLRAELTQTEEKLAEAKTKSARWKQEAKEQSESAARWKQEANAQRESAARAQARADKLRKKLKQASAAPAPSVAEPAETLRVPDETWTVAQLRAEARARGLAGMSNKPKAQLLTALS